MPLSSGGFGDSTNPGNIGVGSGASLGATSNANFSSGDGGRDLFSDDYLSDEISDFRAGKIGTESALDRFSGIRTDVPRDVQIRLHLADPMTGVNALANLFNPIPFTQTRTSTYEDPMTGERYQFGSLNLGLLGFEGPRISGSLMPYEDFLAQNAMEAGGPQGGDASPLAIGATVPAQDIGLGRGLLGVGIQSPAPTQASQMSQAPQVARLSVPSVSQQLGLNPFSGVRRSV